MRQSARKILWVGMVFGFAALIAIAEASDFDNLDREFRDFERKIKTQSPVDTRLKGQQQLLGQDLEYGLKKYEITTAKPMDPAAQKNEERFRRWQENQKKSLQEKLGWKGFFRIPDKYRFVVDMIAFGIFVSFFSMYWYKKKQEHAEKEKQEAARHERYRW